MNDHINPPAPVTDELARNVARNAIAEMVRTVGYNFYGTGAKGDPHVVADTLAGKHTVTWETEVNSAGVPVRRYVLRGDWEVDPGRLQQEVDNPQSAAPRDVVRFLVGADTTSLWTVTATYSTRLGVPLLNLVNDGLGGLRLVKASTVEIVRRAQ